MGIDSLFLTANLPGVYCWKVKLEFCAWGMKKNQQGDGATRLQTKFLNVVAILSHSHLCC